MATIKDVAAKAGVTATTVSRVLNNRGYISEATRAKVMEAMRQLNYQPNEVARSLSKQRTDTIGVIVPHIVHPYFAKLISSLEAACAKQKYKMLLCSTKGEPDKNQEFLELFAGSRVSGIILCSGKTDVKILARLAVPIVCIERDAAEGIATIHCDNYQGGVLATEHLIACGCRRLLHFGAVEGLGMPADQRGAGFRDVCQAHGIWHQERTSPFEAYRSMAYYEEIEKALREEPETDGIFASSDLIAAQVIQVCGELQKKIPTEIKLVGYDDTQIAQLTLPQITTIHQPTEEMAELAVHTILKNRDGSEEPEDRKLAVSLVKRGTT
ncbi:MAG: LacI family DNA-binding transcriptional regulator [Eubacteriales bacterium]|nr:LacI family DNA-binding transcriptional regulator [Eubacteriales bacterium]